MVEIGNGPVSSGEGGMMGCPCNTRAHVYPGMSFCEAFPDGEGIPTGILNGH